MATAAEWQVRIDEAELALHRLATGSMVEEVTGPNNTRTKFMPSNMDKLQQYILFCIRKKREVVSGMGQRPIYFTPSLD